MILSVINKRPNNFGLLFKKACSFNWLLISSCQYYFKFVPPPEGKIGVRVSPGSRRSETGGTSSEGP